MKELNLGSGRALVIVAHPDDETIWMGGTLLMNPTIDWTIFSLCRSMDADRAQKFKKVCDHYGAKSIMTDLEDEGIMNVPQSIPEIEKCIGTHIGSTKVFDYIFTHGPNGEYGHPRHVGVHRAVRRLRQSKKLRCRQCFYFSYAADVHKRVYNKNSSTFRAKLAADTHVKKRNIIKKIYGFSYRSFENVSCLAVETFSS